MEFSDAKSFSECPRFLIAAYLDGEIDAAEEILLERHLAGCEPCRVELNEQKRLLFALDGALDKTSDIVIPDDFAKVVAANAESKVEGLRCPVERGRALFVCGFLILLVLFGLGADSAGSLGVVRAAADGTVAVAAIAGRVVADFAVAVSVIVRSICLQFVFKSAVTAAAFVVAGLASALLISRILRHSRF